VRARALLAVLPVPVLLVPVLLVLLAGCGTLADTHHRPGNSHQVATGTPAPGPAHAEIRIEGGKVSPPPGWLEVARGQTVTITVTSDVPDEVHVHGYDVTADLRPGEPATVTFTAGRSGVFEVETHESGLVLVQVAVR
jgi:FtsP/CotA-like multicopper oxidase with cupredoxin domain